MKKTVTVLLFAALVIGLVILAISHTDIRRQLKTTQAARDSLFRMYRHSPAYFDYVKSGRTKLGILPLQADSSILEAHQIQAHRFDNFFLLRITVRKDGTLRSELLKFSLRNPLTGEGRDLLLRRTEPRIDGAQLAVFKDRINQVNFMQAMQQEDYICCFGITALEWEAVSGDGRHYAFETSCGQSRQFAEACAYLLQQAGDAELRAYSLSVTME